MARGRRFPVGAELTADGQVHVRVWAPTRRRVAVRLEDRPGRREPVELACGEDGYYEGVLPGARAGSLYTFLLDDDPKGYPDPASRYQPDGPHGPSQVVDSGTYRWRDSAWRGVADAGQVLYEMHIGTFTPEGTWAAALEQLPALAELGVTVIEMMPVADFAGRFGWGYDGVNIFAPTRLYGTPDDLRRFNDRAHQLGIAVIHDVVYNHFGPDGNYVTTFSPYYITDKYENEWGDPLNFDGPHAGPVRDYFKANARYWVEEFHFDGLRLDATQQIFDASDTHIIAEITDTVRAAAGGRRTYMVGENEPQQAIVIRPREEGGYGLDTVWNDDFHHSAIVALTGRNEAYYSDHLGRPQEFVSAAKYGFLYQGQHYTWQKAPRGTPVIGVPPQRFVSFIQNHDQIANSATGQRVHEMAHPGNLRAMTALMLLGPGTPMLFQGQEFGASSPFLYFADHKPELAEAVAQGRAEFLSQFSSISVPAVRARLRDPHDPETFRRSKLDHRERETHAELFRLHKDLLRIRREDPAFARPEPGCVDGAVLSNEAFVLRFFGPSQSQDRLLLVNLDRTVRLEPMPEPLLAPPGGMRWEVLWTSEHPDYGGIGTPPLEPLETWILPAKCALLLGARQVAGLGG